MGETYFALLKSSLNIQSLNEGVELDFAFIPAGFAQAGCNVYLNSILDCFICIQTRKMISWMVR